MKRRELFRFFGGSLAAAPLVAMGLRDQDETDDLVFWLKNHGPGEWRSVRERALYRLAVLQRRVPSSPHDPW